MVHTTSLFDAQGPVASTVTADGVTLLVDALEDTAAEAVAGLNVISKVDGVKGVCVFSSVNTQLKLSRWFRHLLGARSLIPPTAIENVNVMNKERKSSQRGIFSLTDPLFLDVDEGERGFVAAVPVTGTIDTSSGG